MAVPILDITLVETYNLYYIAITDISEYPPNWNIQNVSFEVTPPGFLKINVPFTPKSTNYYKSSHLGITCGVDEDCVPLPDGIWKMKYSIKPNSTYWVEKSFMRVNQIRCDYGEAFLKVDLLDECSKNKKQLKDKLQQINILIEGSVAAANACDFERATKYYEKAKFMLDNFNKDCNCG